MAPAHSSQAGDRGTITSLALAQMQMFQSLPPPPPMQPIAVDHIISEARGGGSRGRGRSGRGRSDQPARPRTRARRPVDVDFEEWKDLVIPKVRHTNLIV